MSVECAEQCEEGFLYVEDDEPDEEAVDESDDDRLDRSHGISFMGNDEEEEHETPAGGLLGSQRKEDKQSSSGSNDSSKS